MSENDDKPEETQALATIEEPRCPNCLGELRGRNVATGKPAAPGDCLVCKNCGSLLELNDAGKPERMSPTTMEEVSRIAPNAYRSMMAARKKILRSIEKRSKPTVN